MRIRSIKPEYWRSVDITGLDIADRFLFIGLWSYVDDNGVGVDDDATIIGDLFARDMFRDPRETVARVSGGLSKLADRGLIVRYVVKSRPYLFVTNWEKHQRIDKPAKPRFPRPDSENAILATSSRESRDILAPGTGEQGNREQGNREQVSLSPDEPDDPGTLLPDEWRPNQNHVDKANSLHLDVQHEYRRFRDHAERTQRRQVSWNTAFTNWLRKGAEMAQQRQGRSAQRPPTRTEQNLAFVAQMEAKYGDTQKEISK